MDSGSSDPAAPDASDYGIPDSRERFAIQRDAIAEKLQTVLLPAMRSHGIDMWIVLDRENNEEPLHVELGGGFAGVRGAFIFHDNGSDTVEKLYYSSHEQPANSVISQVYDETIYYGYSREGLTPHLRKAIEDRDPQTIGVNTSHTLPEADGLTVGLRNFLVDAIGPEYASRIVSAELLVRDFRLQRTPRRNRHLHRPARLVGPLDGGSALHRKHRHRRYHCGRRFLVAAGPGTRVGAHRRGHRPGGAGGRTAPHPRSRTSRSNPETSWGSTAGSAISTTPSTSSAPPTS